MSNAPNKSIRDSHDHVVGSRDSDLYRSYFEPLLLQRSGALAAALTHEYLVTGVAADLLRGTLPHFTACSDNNHSLCHEESPSTKLSHQSSIYCRR